MDSTHADKRRFERYTVQLPAMLDASAARQESKLLTKDISAGGAFCYTARPFQEGEQVSMKIHLENDTFERLTGYRSCIEVKGTVVRCTAEGIAVQFGDYRIMPLSGSC